MALTKKICALNNEAGQYDIKLSDKTKIHVNPLYVSLHINAPLETTIGELDNEYFCDATYINVQFVFFSACTSCPTQGPMANIYSVGSKQAYIIVYYTINGINNKAQFTLLQ